MAKQQRLYYLDWLRVGVFGLLIIFHCSRLFDFFPWHIKNEAQSELVTQFFLFITSWMMPMIFFVSGASTFYALKSQKEAFIKSRFKRLVIPFCFGILLLIPPQKYYEYLFYNDLSLSYGAFLAIYPGQLASANNGFDLTWLGLVGYHLWYLPYLFIHTLVALPLFKRLQQDRDHQIWSWANGFSQLFIILIMINVALRPLFPSYLSWADFIHFFFFFFLGFMFVKFRETMTRKLMKSLVFIAFLALFTSLLTHYFALFTPYMIKWFDQPDFSIDYLGFVTFRAVNSLAWVLLILSLSIRFLNKQSSILGDLNEAVLPIYLLHQTFIVGLGFYIVQWSWPMYLKFLSVLILTLILMYPTYLLIKNSKVLRFVFGMKTIF